MAGAAYADSDYKKDKHPSQSQWDKKNYAEGCNYENPTPKHNVPDAGSTAALLSLGVAGLAFVRRFAS